ncbi:MAG: acyclic terpene utilization AtuA family protein [Jatrophihabitans sp.]|uniref:acyclic terpene utilization AtuA family protein n=1 Tax=Jatrophihabitans sp. TaxID=1932789 RepID=UPI003915519C
MSAPLRIANASGFYGDRASAMYEQLTGGEIDVLTGDYLAELTMLILGRDRLKDPKLGYAKTFLRHLESTLGTALERGVRIVANAGGLNPAGLAAAVRILADNLGIDVAVAHVEGDDLRARAGELGLGEPLAANAYLGAWGIADCLAAGADVVVTGRVTDASLVVGPAAAHFGWTRTSYDELAGAVIAGHVIECGPQATGGNYAFFRELPALDRPLGFPIAEVHADGSSVITKHPGTGGAVTVGTVTAQLLYEIGGARYAGPDVTARFDTVTLSDDGPDRVRISGVRGEPPPPTLKVGLNTLGGFRNEVTFVLTGLDIEAKADWLRSQLASLDATWTLARTDHPDAAVQEEAAALLHCVVRGIDPKALGRAFSGAAIELALASYPGFHVTAPPGEASPYGVFSAAYVPASEVPHVAVHPDGARVDIVPATDVLELAPVAEPPVAGVAAGPTRAVPLGLVAGARSGDKGGSANVGVWARTDEAFRWLTSALTVAEFQRLLPETAALPVTRHALPNLRALNFVVEDVLGQGVASNARHDPQAKAIGEWLRSRVVDVPEVLL